MPDINNSKDRLNGEAEEAKGKLKEGAGRATGNDDLKAEGKVDQRKGNAEVAAAKLKEKTAKAADDLKDKVGR